MTETAGIDVQWVAHGPPALEALAAVIGAARNDDPLRPVTVVAPTKVAGLTLRRTLASRPGGIVGVRFQVLAQVAEALAAPVMAQSDRTPLTPATRRELVRLALRATPGRLAPVADHPATVDAVDRAVQQVRAATAVGGDDALLAALDGDPGIPAALAGVIRTVDRWRHRWYDEHDLVLAAADVVATGGGSEVGPVVVHLPSQLTDAERALVRALGAQGPVTVLAGHTGDGAADDRTAALIDGLDGPRPPEATLDLDELDVIVTVDPDEEVREAARLVAAAMHDGRDLARMAVLYRASEPYASLVHEVFEAADLPHNGTVAGTLAQTIAGRFLLEAWDWHTEHLPRAGLLDLLGALPVRTADGPVPAARWADTARRARVIGSRAQWRDRLAGYAETQQAEAERAPRDDWRDRGRREAERARALQEFALGLADTLQGPADLTWAGWSAWALGLLDGYLGQARGHWPEQDADAEGEIRQRLLALTQLDEIRTHVGDDAAPVTAIDARQVIEAELGNPTIRHGSVGVGVHVGPLGTAGAGDLDHVIVLGTVEGQLPPRMRHSALLPDSLVTRLRAGDAPVAGAAGLVTVPERVAIVRQALARVMAGAGRVTFTLPRANRRDQRAALPAPWLLELLGRRQGNHVTVKDVLEDPEKLEVVRSVDSAIAGLHEATVPAGPREAALRALAEFVDAGGTLADDPLVADRPTLARAAGVLAARAGTAFTAYDGLVDDHHEFLTERLATLQSGGTLSAFTECPRRWLFGHVLGVRQVDEPRKWLDIDSLDRGNLVHTVLEHWVLEALPGAQPVPHAGAPGSRERLRELFDAACAQLVAHGRTGPPQLWRYEAERLWGLLETWLGQDTTLRASLGVEPIHAELPFGMGGEHGTDELRVPTGAGPELRLRGKIDRIDASPDRSTVIVTDYKTGRQGRYSSLDDDIALGGRELQLPVYALVAAREHPEAEIHVGYWHVHTSAYKTGPKIVPVDDAARRRIQQVMDAVAGGVTDGVFPANPGPEVQFPQPGHEHCGWCPFDTICPSHGERIRESERARQADPVRRTVLPIWESSA